VETFGYEAASAGGEGLREPSLILGTQLILAMRANKRLKHLVSIYLSMHLYRSIAGNRLDSDTILFFVE